MDQNTAMIREQIAETRDSLAESLLHLEHRVKDTVKNVRNSIHKASLQYQVQNHPLLMFGGSIAAGVAAGALVFKRGSEKKEGVPSAAFRQGALSMVALGLGEIAKRYLSSYPEEVDLVIRGLVEDLGPERTARVHSRLP